MWGKSHYENGTLQKRRSPQPLPWAAYGEGCLLGGHNSVPQSHKLNPANKDTNKTLDENANWSAPWLQPVSPKAEDPAKLSQTPDPQRKGAESTLSCFNWTFSGQWLVTQQYKTKLTTDLVLIEATTFSQHSYLFTSLNETTAINMLKTKIHDCWQKYQLAEGEVNTS